MEKIMLQMDSPVKELENTLVGFLGGVYILMGQPHAMLSGLGGSMFTACMVAAAAYAGQKGMKMIDKYLTAKWEHWKHIKSKFKNNKNGTDKL